MSNITNDWIAWKSTASMRKGRTIGKVIDQNCLKGDARSTSAAS